MKHSTLVGFITDKHAVIDVMTTAQTMFSKPICMQLSPVSGHLTGQHKPSMRPGIDTWIAKTTLRHLLESEQNLTFPSRLAIFLLYKTTYFDR